MTYAVPTLTEVQGSWGGKRKITNEATGLAGYLRVSQDETGEELAVDRQREAVIALAVRDLRSSGHDPVGPGRAGRPTVRVHRGHRELVGRIPDQTRDVEGGR